MLLKDCPARPAGRRFSLADQARAWSVILSDEFGVPFVFYEVAAEGPAPAAVWGEENGLTRPLSASTLGWLLADGRPRVEPADGGHHRLALLLFAAGKPALVAVAEMPVLVPGGPAAAQEQARLQKWAQAVADRLRLSDQLAGQRRSEGEAGHQVQVCWEALLTLSHLLHRLRIHKDPERNRRRILEAAFGLLDAQALVWVPHAADIPAVVQGEACLAAADCRQLAVLLAPALEARPGEPLVCNDVASQPWGGRFPHLANVLAFALDDGGPLGWVLALNKGVRKPADKETRGEGGAPTAAGFPTPESRPPFRKSDAALLTPFVAALGLHARSSDRYQDLKELLVGLTRSLTSALDAKDSYTYGHSERVARIAVELGREMGLSGEELGDVYLAGLLHDVGKIGVRDAILSKRGALTPEEFEHIKQHVITGYTILSDLRPIRHLLPGVLYHHERVDGTGYPDGLAGDAIPLLARLLAVADAYDAMSTTRPYREAMPCRKVEETLVQGAGKQWDSQVVEAFLRCRLRVHAIRQRGVGESLRSALDGALRKEKNGSSVVPAVG